ncbi:MAG: GTPase Era [Proteobacteria bacterium]|nr:GTPase Era [Pseudomonadota bacterium]
MKCGYIAIIGRPNVGKSTLLNHLLNEKISITSRKPQTTRHRILGVKTAGEVQFIYVDTPGLHSHEGRALNRYMNRTALKVLLEVDVIVLVVDAKKWHEQDDWILKRLKQVEKPIILAVNKIDKLTGRSQLLPYLQAASERFAFFSVIPISAKRGDQLTALTEAVQQFLPQQPHLFPADQVTDRTDRFIAAETIREKLTRFLGQELPYALTVTIEQFEDLPEIVKISAIIWIEKPSQKPIVIGEGGERLKIVGQKARLDLQKYLDKKVFLRLWVKIKSGWSDDERSLRQLGYGAE